MIDCRTFEKFDSHVSLTSHFKDNKTCKEFLVKQRWAEWFMAMYLISSHKKGISSHQLARDLSVTQKTGWYLSHKLRTLFGQDVNIELSDDVECTKLISVVRRSINTLPKRLRAIKGVL